MTKSVSDMIASLEPYIKILLGLQKTVEPYMEMLRKLQGIYEKLEWCRMMGEEPSIELTLEIAGILDQIRKQGKRG